MQPSPVINWYLDQYFIHHRRSHAGAWERENLHTQQLSAGSEFQIPSFSWVTRVKRGTPYTDRMTGHCVQPRKAKHNENTERIGIYSQRVLKFTPGA